MRKTGFFAFIMLIIPTIANAQNIQVVHGGAYGTPLCWDGVENFNKPRLKKINKRCVGKKSCRVKIDDSLLGFDPNPRCARRDGVRPYSWYAVYDCPVKKNIQLTCPEGTTMVIACPKRKGKCM